MLSLNVAVQTTKVDPSLEDNLSPDARLTMLMVIS
jgi:hypothetical protein